MMEEYGGINKMDKNCTIKEQEKCDVEKRGCERLLLYK